MEWLVSRPVSSTSAGRIRDMIMKVFFHLTYMENFFSGMKKNNVDGRRKNGISNFRMAGWVVPPRKYMSIYAGHTYLVGSISTIICDTLVSTWD